MKIQTEERPCVGGFITFYMVTEIEDGDFKLLRESFPQVTEFVRTLEGLEFKVFKRSPNGTTRVQARENDKKHR